MELEYGKWCTVRGQRLMIVGWTKNTVTVFVSPERGEMTFDKSVVENVSDFKMTDSERRAAGYAF
jgi:hypothetical protein